MKINESEISLVLKKQLNLNNKINIMLTKNPKKKLRNNSCI